MASIWSLLTFLMLWYFGSMLERDLGRNQTMRLYVTIWAVLTIVTGLFGVFLNAGLAGLGHLEPRLSDGHPVADADHLLVRAVRATDGKWWLPTSKYCMPSISACITSGLRCPRL